MPNTPPLSQLPGFIPASEARSRVRDIFSDAAASAAFVQHIARLANEHNPTSDREQFVESEAKGA